MRFVPLTTSADKLERLTKRQRPFFPTDKQLPTNVLEGQSIKPAPMVKAKMEKASEDSADDLEGEDEAEGGGHGISRDGTARPVAKRIYKKALKILKQKLYFENFFPTDAEKDGLPYSCWTSAVESMGRVDGGSTAARRMFYTFGYDDVVRVFTSGPVPRYLISHYTP